MEETKSSDEILSEDKLVLLTAVSSNAPTDVVTRLISPSNVNVPGKNGDTLLHVVVRAERWKLVPVLLQHGADINLCNDSQKTPLHVAARHGPPADIISQLISPQNIHMQNNDGETSLHVAVRAVRWKLVPVLLQHGADVNLGNDCHETTLYLAARHGAPADVISQLISPHNIHMQQKDGDTALHEALRWKRWQLVPVLLQHGADPFILNLLPEPPRPLSLQSLCITTIRRHMPVKSDEAYERLGLPQRLLPELKLKLLADEIVAMKKLEGLK